jgi:hypothetical protein
LRYLPKTIEDCDQPSYVGFAGLDCPYHSIQDLKMNTFS